MLYRLKFIRVFISLFFLFVTTLLFLDFHELIKPSVFDTVLFLQFVPSLLDFINVTSIAAAGFIVVLILSLLFGRVYCSFICPLGTLMDMISFIRKKFKKKFKYVCEKPLNLLRYSILTIIIMTFAAGSTFGVLLLDPFSNFGRIIVFFFRPIVIGTNNITASIMESVGSYAVLPYVYQNHSLSTYVLPITILSILLLLSFFKGRLFCNSICPVGSLLGLISKLSLYKISIDHDNCTNCGVCENVCKAGCIESESKKIDYSRCVACYNCLQVCPTEGILYDHSVPRKVKTQFKPVNIDKRNFLFSSAIFLFNPLMLRFVQNQIVVYKKSTIPVIRKLPIAPPGSKSIEHIKDYCAACNLCVSVCPTNVLQPSFLEYGFTGMLTPLMDNKKGFCNYECIKCLQVCPTGAITCLSLEEKKLTQLGKSKLIKDNCIVYTQGTACGACAEHCPTKAVRMIPEDKLKVPKIDDEICTGCGACEFACPTIPYKAIYIVANEVHQKAKKPHEEKLEIEINLEEEFPF